MSLLTQLCESDSDAAEKILVDHVTPALEDGSLGTIVQVLKDIYSGSSSLNPLESVALSVLPLVLVPAIRGDDSSRELVRLIGIHANAKEAIISIDELMDPDYSMVQNDEGPDDALDTRLVLILNLYQSTVPRLVIRKKPSTETLRPILERLSDAIVTLSHSETSVFNVMTSASRLADVAFTWATQSHSGSSSEGHEAIKKVLTEFLLKSLVACSSRIDPDIALRVFQKVQPRYTLPRLPAPVSHSHATRELVLLIYTTFSRIQDSSELGKYSDSEPIVTLGALVLSVHVQHLNPPLPRAPLAPPLKGDIMTRTIIPALISSTATVPILAYLAHAIYSTNSTMSDFPDSTISALVHALTPIASMHSTPSTRHIAFRLLSTLIQSYIHDDAICLSTLLELITDEAFPQMRTAAVGLLRSTVLAALASRKTRNPHAKSFLTSPEMLYTVSPVIFQPYPRDLFRPFADRERGQRDHNSNNSDDNNNNSNIDTGSKDEHMLSFLRTFIDSPEPGRLTEALNFYYALLLADKQDQTGVQGHSHAKDTEMNLLRHLRPAFTVWQESNDPEIEQIVTSRLGPLFMAMENVDRISPDVSQG